MTINAYAIFDEKSSLFNKPFFAVTNGQAMRSFGEMVSDPQSMANKYPEDFKLYFIGTYDDQIAWLESTKTPIFLCHATEYKKNPTPMQVMDSVLPPADIINRK